MSRVNQILKKHSLTGPYPQEKYIMNMEQRFKKRGIKYLDIVDKYFFEGFTPLKWKKLYSEKNTHEAMSVYISSHVYTKNYQQVLNWLEQNIEKQPDSFIEIGCENGLLTLCISDLWPGVKARGLDQLSNAINVARKLATKHSNPNAKFYYADITKANSCIEIPKSSLVIAPFIFHELMEQPEEDWINIGENILSLLNNDGSLISFNRFGQPEFYNPILEQYLGLVGLAPTKRDILEVDWETFPITIFQKK